MERELKMGRVEMFYYTLHPPPPLSLTIPSQPQPPIPSDCLSFPVNPPSTPQFASMVLLNSLPAARLLY